jgi:hypothetical protein
LNCACTTAPTVVTKNAHATGPPETFTSNADANRSPISLAFALSYAILVVALLEST